jgi:hypothetical protein
MFKLISTPKKNAYVILNRYQCEIFQIDGRTKWWNRCAQDRKKDRKKETMKERRKKTIMSESLTTDN